MTNIIFYTFAGRRQNMAVQLPLIRRILDEHPNVTFDVWNLTKLFADEEYVKRIKGERIRVRHDFHNKRPWWRRFDYVWRHYAQPQYRDTLFVKIDDDVVFLQTDRFGDFIEAAQQRPDAVTSALTINNGASIKHTPGMTGEFRKLKIPLLDVHEHGEFAKMSHNYAIQHWPRLLNMPVKAVPTKDWLSINLIAYHWDLGRRIAEEIGKPHPEEIAGRVFESGFVGDEGACNLFPRQIVKGFLAAHLTFGPQNLPKEEWDVYRKQYAEAGRIYLEADR